MKELFAGSKGMGCGILQRNGEKKNEFIIIIIFFLVVFKAAANAFVTR